MTRKRKIIKELQRQILLNRGLTRKKKSKLQPLPIVPTGGHNYTRSMAVLEAYLQVDFSIFLFSDTEQKLADLLGVNKWTVHRWRKRINQSGERKE